ncbi:amidase family protein [Mycobacterium sp.]|uniref:amidase family protein n=1 Tax=Mycobacterium sp. TaxID=1785 RepID=UPI003C73D7FE
MPFLSTMMVSRVPTPPPRGLHGSRFTHGHNDFERLLAALIADLQALRDAFREIYNPNEATAPASAKSPCATAAACTNSASDAPGGPFFRRAPRCAGDAGGSPVGVRRCFRDFDVLLCPVTPMTATPHGVQELVINGVTASWLHVMDITSFFNLTGLPALSVPYGFSSEKLPIGIQLVSQWFDESTILRLGALLERKGGLGDRRPPVSA